MKGEISGKPATQFGQCFMIEIVNISLKSLLDFDSTLISSNPNGNNATMFKSLAESSLRYSLQIPKRLSEILHQTSLKANLGQCPPSFLYMSKELGRRIAPLVNVSVAGSGTRMTVYSIKTGKCLRPVL